VNCRDSPGTWNFATAKVVVDAVALPNDPRGVDFQASHGHEEDLRRAGKS